MVSQPPIIIIGNGIAGITTARHIRKRSDIPILIISKESRYFFSRTALMYVYMGHLKWEHTQPYENHFWKKNRLDLCQETVTNIDPQVKTVKLSNGSILSYTSLVLATGSLPNKFGWPGENLKGVQGLYSKQDLENLEALSSSIKEAVVVGGGLIGIELAEMLHARGKKVTFLVREESFWNTVIPEGDSKMINRHIISHGIDLRLSTNLSEIIEDENGRAKAIRTDKNEIIPCQFVGLTVGVRPNIDFIKHTSIATNKGILVNKYLETSQTDIYAVGDCAEQQEPLPGRRPIEAVWYTGRMMGETLAKTLTGKKTAYQPGHWFNSAKFFDIEYQTYGWIGTQAEPNETRFYWEHSNGKKCLHFSFDKKSKVFLGVNALGIRLRHEFFNRVMEQKKTIYYVLEHFKEALFDPEFYPSHEREVIIQFNQEQNTELSIKKKPWFKFFSNTTPGS